MRGVVIFLQIEILGASEGGLKVEIMIGSFVPGSWSAGVRIITLSPYSGEPSLGSPLWAVILRCVFGALAAGLDLVT